jgi:hypothetical protein
MFKANRIGNYLKINSTASEETFTVSGSNKKVNFPIISFGSALECVNKLHCPYSKFNKDRTTTSPRCYAQQAELRWTNVRESREANWRFIVDLKEANLLVEFGEFVATEIWLAWRSPIVRYNEGGDIDITQAIILMVMQAAFNELVEGDAFYLPKKPPQLYGYSHSSPKLIKDLRESGVICLESDKQFKVFKDASEVPDGAYICPGECKLGKCVACCLSNDAENIWIKKH